jgi:glyoxylase-like metal-dependent hydrolase (beta-lactamase superfamily II)
VGGVKALAEQTGCKVYIHREDLTLPNRLTLGTIPYTHHYDEGDVVELAGLSFRILHTPGHTPGGVCILCEDAMFAGDTLFAGTCGRTDLPGSSPRDMRRSLTRLAGLEGEYTVLPGHGEASTLSYEKKTNPYLQ